MRFFNQFARYLSLVTILGLAITSHAQAAESQCQPTKAAVLYPSLAGKTITLGQDGESPPFSMRDPKDFNRLDGLDAALARAVFQCAGIPMTFKTGNWSGLIPATMSGQIDVMWDQLLYTPERAKKLDFIVYMNSATGMLVAKGNPRHLTSMDALCGITATASLGTTQEAMLREQSDKCVKEGKSAIQVITSADIPSGLRLLQNGRADLMAGNKFVVDRMALTNPTTLESGFSVVTGAKLAAGTAKGNPELVKAITDNLAIIRANGTMKKIFDEYKVDYGLTVPPVVLAQ